MAAITHEIATASTSNASSYASASFTPAVNDLLVVMVVASGTIAAGSVSNSAGITFTKITSALKNLSADTIYLFVANSLVSSASAMTCTFDCTGDSATGAVVTVFAISGMSKTGANAVRQSAKTDNQLLGGTPAATFASACLTGNPTVGIVGNGTNPATITPPTNWTELSDTGYNTPATGSEYAARNSGFTGTTITWGGTSGSAYGAIIAEFDINAAPVDLVVQDGTHAHGTDGVGLTTASALAVDEAAHAHAADNLTLSLASSADLAIAEATHAHSAEAPVLSAESTLAVQEAAHGHTADNLGLTSDAWLAIAEASHGHLADNLTLTAATALQPANATHGHTAENAALSTDSLLAVADAGHAHAADNLVLDTAATTPLVVADANHGHAAESPTFTAASTLAVSEAAHAHQAEAPVLTTLSWLEVQEAAHAHGVEQITLSVEVALAVAEALHGHAAENLVLNTEMPQPVASARAMPRVQTSARQQQTSGAIRVNVQTSRRTWH